MGNLTVAFRKISHTTGTIARWFFHALRESTINLVFLAGAGLIDAGIWRISESLGLIVAGAFCILTGVLLTFRDSIRERTSGA